MTVPAAQAEWQKAIRSYRAALKQAVPAARRIEAAARALEQHLAGDQASSDVLARLDLRRAYDDALM
jgi:hypothetical protein